MGGKHGGSPKKDKPFVPEKPTPDEKKGGDGRHSRGGSGGNGGGKK
ncbi:hypothetical protein ACTMTI_07080 [Nonomuraea sp. H19]